MSTDLDFDFELATGGGTSPATPGEARTLPTSAYATAGTKEN